MAHVYPLSLEGPPSPHPSLKTSLRVISSMMLSVLHPHGPARGDPVALGPVRALELRLTRFPHRSALRWAGQIMGYSLATQRGVHTGCTWCSIRNVNSPFPSQVYVNQNSGAGERGTSPGDSNTHWSRPFPGVLFCSTSFSWLLLIVW